jgi:hypothetical protein
MHHRHPEVRDREAVEHRRATARARASFEGRFAATSGWRKQDEQKTGGTNDVLAFEN